MMHHFPAITFYVFLPATSSVPVFIPCLFLPFFIWCGNEGSSTRVEEIKKRDKSNKEIAMKYLNDDSVLTHQKIYLIIIFLIKCNLFIKTWIIM